ncbi:nicotinate-nucleotide adenylyltransferase [Pelagicoccus sp. SDUM812002]|uniref:nicotinate-nucleotide adenylyltransferase n=1 Tax=Pelagicoccus sp. SDUM812002 TaxID=3041266 RepID=UPI00280D2BBD|nr:nicotinate-nucleotide adenylyltransferase [Pelagicoccus sp. SDUM812002]MDQ8187624.1 nicotinate-nucleotide adenylyltransferase [Pelagicoccus sp. SDUM812002]
MTERIGIIGGSFDPIHNGHLIIALDASEQFELDLVLFVPAFQAPLKSKAPESTPPQRMRMVELATEEEPRFACSDVDYRCESTSYSVRTAQILSQEHPAASLFWILGADQIAQLHLWRNIEELAKLVSFIAFERPGSAYHFADELPTHTRILRGQSRQLEISSTEIRDRFKSGRSAKYFLPANVFDYIKAENLYS